MRVFKPMTAGLLTRPYEFRRSFRLGVAVLACVPLGHEPGIVSEVALWKMLGEELPPDQALDAVMPKALGEYLVTGRAYAPGGVPARAVRVGVKLGDRSKSLIVTGDRHIEDDRVTDPVPFTEMPVDWQHAFGGEKSKENPLGRGMQEEPIQGVGFRVRLANVLDPAVPPEDRQRRPAGFGPVDVTWQPRASLGGTYGEEWLRDDFPGLARDIDWRFFNIAPRDQHFPRPFTGDEDYAIENMHPEEPMLQGRLPGLVPRFFVVRRGAEEVLEEVGLGLTTVWFFPHRRRAVLVHHGDIAIQEEDGRDILRVLAAVELRGRPRDIAHYQEVMRNRMHPEHGTIHTLRESDLAPIEIVRPDPDLEADEALFKSEGLILRHSHRRHEIEVEERRKMVAGFGLDPDEHAPHMPKPIEPLPELDAIPAFIERALKEAEEHKQKEFAAKAQRDEELKVLLKDGPLSYEELEAERTTLPTGPPTFTAAGKRREMEAIAQQMREAGMDPFEIEEIIADPVHQKIWAQAEEGAREIYRRSAHDQGPAPQMPGARRKRLRREIEEAVASGDPAARQLPRADLCGADLSGLDLSGFDLREAWLDGANLAGADLRRADLRNAVLAHAMLEGARLDGADLVGANLGRARLRGASLVRTNLKTALFAHADLEAAVLRGALLEEADLSEVRLLGTDLSYIQGRKIILMKASLAGIVLAGADLEGAALLEVNLQGAVFRGASLVSVTFLKADARGMDCSGANLSKSAFVETCNLEGANFARATMLGTNLRGAHLQGADFTDALLDDADLSECNLAAANLTHVRARRARFVAADLRRAVLARGDFMHGMLARADLRGTDLSEASFYEADLARVRTDRETRYDGINQTRMRLRPRRQETPG